MWSAFKLALRGAVWRTTPDPPLVGLPVLIGWTLVLAVVRVAVQYIDAAPSPTFTPYGLNAVVASLAIALAVAAFFVRPEARATALSAMVVLSILTEVALLAIRLGSAHIPPWSPQSAIISFFPSLDSPAVAHSLDLALPVFLFLGPIVYWVGAMLAIMRSLQAEARLTLLGKVIALWAALFVAKGLVPHAPVFHGPGFDVRTANLWEYAHAKYLARQDVAQRDVASQDSTRQDPAQQELPADAETDAARAGPSQGALLQAAIARLAPQQPGATDIFALGLAGWSDLDVFPKEIEGAFTSLAAILPIQDRTVRLINNRTTADTFPLASRRNFAAAVHAIGLRMDKNEDVLLLVMSSHGSAAGFALQLPGGSSQVLTPHEVKTVLDGEGIRNRVVIVSACFSGTFVKPLANDDTIVLTAADERSTSFGCAAGRDWTYFGDALFRQGVQPGTNLERAFDHARILIRGWEMMDRLPPSNPQAHFGPALVAKLEAVLKAMGGQ
ncbi:MAG: hypothetical protein QOI40_4442 [Alphaproteobacteria bacterium]|nr:hypothetical protein [Alphaproteobacteria bacterium]